MGTGHSDLDRLVAQDRRFQGSWLSAVIVAVAVVTAGGLIWLWPRGPDLPRNPELVVDVVTATVQSVRDGECSFSSDFSCHRVIFEITGGPEAGTVTSQEFQISITAPRFEEGDRVVLNQVDTVDPLLRYQYADRDRRPMLWALGAFFAAAVIGLGRLRGLAALIGLTVSVGILVAFIAPAILMGRSPVLVAAVGGSAIALVALYLAHGWRPLTHVAAIGTFCSLALTLLLSSAVASVAQFSGFGSEEALFLTFVDGLQIQGLILAGAVLGAIGALDDVTVTQASTIFELHRLRPSVGRWELFEAGLRVGRDHIASTVNTLLLAYAGASMPLLLLFSLAEMRLDFVANSEVVAVEIFRTLVGSIGLVASVPITTWLAASVVRHRPKNELANPA